MSKLGKNCAFIGKVGNDVFGNTLIFFRLNIWYNQFETYKFHKQRLRSRTQKPQLLKTNYSHKVRYERFF